MSSGRNVRTPIPSSLQTSIIRSETNKRQTKSRYGILRGESSVQVPTTGAIQGQGAGQGPDQNPGQAQAQAQGSPLNPPTSNQNQMEGGGGGGGVPPTRIMSPMFSPKTDDELGHHLQSALKKSMELIEAEGLASGSAHSGSNGMDSAGAAKWAEFLSAGLLCDCFLKSKEGTEFGVHRVIMSAASPFFRGVFNKLEKNGPLRGPLLLGPFGQAPLEEPFLSEEPEPVRLNLGSVDSPCLSALIQFAYTGKADLSTEVAQRLLPLGSKWRMLPVLQQASNYLVENMTPENCLRLYTAGRPYFCPTLDSLAKKFILHNFREITRTQEFLELKSEALQDIMGDDHLNARNEAMVFEAIRSWVEFNPIERKSKISQLLNCVRFGLMSYGYFTNVVFQWSFVDEEVRRTLYAPSMFLAQIDSLNNSEVDLNDPLARPRIPHEIIFAVGGWSAGSPTSFMETYDVRADRWFLSNNPDSTPRAYHGLVSLGHFVYMIGGFDGNEHFSTVRRYDPVLKIWEEKSCMLNARCYVSCCHLDGIIYACGGYNGRLRMASVERYTPTENLWELVAPMNRQRSDASAASVKGKVYVAGGFTGTEVLNSVETFDPKEGQWTFIQPMNTARSGVSVVAYRDCLYAIGGFNGFNRLNTGERYNPEEPGPWKIIPEMSSARSNFSAVCADELLICIGGFNGATTIPYVECYDSKVNEWFDASHMNLNRSALSACVVSNLPNAQEYSYMHKVQELLGITATTT